MTATVSRPHTGSRTSPTAPLQTRTSLSTSPTGTERRIWAGTGPAEQPPARIEAQLEPAWAWVLDAVGTTLERGGSPARQEVGSIIRVVIACDRAEFRALSGPSAQGQDIGPNDFAPRRLRLAGSGGRSGQADDHQLRMATGRAGSRTYGWILHRNRDFLTDDLVWAGRLLPLLMLLDRVAIAERAAHPATGVRPVPGRSVASTGRTAAPVDRRGSGRLQLVQEPATPRAGATLAGSAETGPSLTPRELEVLALVASGLTAEAIGRRTGISGATVRKHLEHVYAKLGHHDRLTAVDVARRRGLLPLDVPLGPPRGLGAAGASRL